MTRLPEQYEPPQPLEDTPNGISVSDALAAASAAHRETTRLIRMLTVLGEGGDVDGILERTLYTLSDLFDTDAVVALAPSGPSEVRLVAHCGLGEDLAADVPTWPVGPALAESLRTLAPVRAPAPRADLPEALDELGVREVLWLPGGEVDELVVLGLLRCAGRSFDGSAVEVLRTVANRLGVALDGARHASRIEQLGRLGRQVSAQLDPDQVLATAIDELPGIFAAEAATVALLQDDGDVLFPDRYGVAACRGHRQPLESLVAWEQVRQGKPFVAHPGDPEITSQWPDYANWTSVLGVPIPAQDQLVGVLYLARRNGLPFSTGARDALMLFSAQLGSALDNAWLYVALRDSQEELQLITDSISDLVSVLDADGRCVYASPSHRRQLGVEPAEMIGTAMVSMVHPDDRDRVVAELATAATGLGPVRPVEYRAQLGAGRQVWLETAVTRLLEQRDDGATRAAQAPRLVLSSRLVSDRKQLEAQLRHAATTDELTGLPNRRYLLELLEEALAAGSAQRLALLFLDLDRFKAVNDSLGHAAGDQLLVEVANRLRLCLVDATRTDDVIARLGGDEFVLLLRGLDPVLAAGEANCLAERILVELSKPLRIGGRIFDVTASIGIVLPEPAEASNAAAAAHEVLRAADTAMYQAKARGRARSATFDADLDRSMRNRLDLAADLRGAADRDELRLHYQPVVDASGRMTGVEALLRWEHPVRGNVPPLDVIPLAEEMGIIGSIGRWVLRTACRQAAEWNALREQQALAPLAVAVNLSPSQVEDGLLDVVAHELASSGLDPARLLLEVTETAYMEPASTAPEVLARLRALGVRIAIDDFGTGFSSFDRLRRFPADVLKIDRSFVCALDGGPAAGAIVRAMIDLARALGSDVVAEGVERSEQARALVDAGCGLLQGWLYAPARPVDELADLVLGQGSLVAPSAVTTASPAPRPAIPSARTAGSLEQSDVAGR